MLEKVVWTDADFELMGWHDATIHAIAFDEGSWEGRILFDLDYIVQWVEPEPPSVEFEFDVAPATLIFEKVASFEAQILAYPTVVQIQDIHREPKDDRQLGEGARLWTVEGHHSRFGLRATGFRQHFRKRPIRTRSQSLGTAERGAISFAEPTEFPD